MNLNGDCFFSIIQKEKIDKLQITQEEKENYKNNLKDLKEKISSRYINWKIIKKIIAYLWLKKK